MKQKQNSRRLVLPLIVFALAFLPFSAHAETADRIDLSFERTGNYWVAETPPTERAFSAILLEGNGEVASMEADVGNGWRPVDWDDDTDHLDALLFTQPTDSARFRIPLQAAQAPEASVRLVFSEAPLAHNPEYQLSGPQTASGLQIISRAQWGADESIRYWSPEQEDTYQGNGNESDAGATDSCADFATRFADETAIEKTIEMSPAGDILNWPISYVKKVRKIVVHHTDSELRDVNGDLRMDGQDYKAMVRAIYQFHTLTRGWGDIGYNYIIDPLGNIYEGRYGGDKVIGAHARCYNNGSIGISIIGDYEKNNVPEPALNSLVRLIALKSQQFGIDPTIASSFRGKVMPNILGHRDVGHTTCPGGKLYGLLPKIRERAGFVLRSGAFGQISVSDQPFEYNAEPLSEASLLTLKPNEQKSITFRFKNTGTKSWDSNTWFHVSLNDRETARVIPLVPDKSFVAAALKETAVPPGGTGTFVVDFESGFFPEKTIFELTPVINGRYKVSRAAIQVPIQVEEPNFGYSVVRRSFPQGIVYQGQKLQGELVLQNTGNVTWVNYGPKAIRIGTESVRDHRSILSPKSPTRLAHLLETEVPPGGQGTFAFDLDVPLKFEGEIKERFTPVIERIAWLENKGLGFDVIVRKPLHMARVVEKSSVPTLQPGETRKVSVTLENRGDVAWDSENMVIGLLAKGIKVFKKEIIPSNTVDPKTSATFDFWVQAPYKAVEGSVYLNSKFRKIPIRGGAVRFQVEVPEPRLRAQKVSQSTRSVNLRPGEERELEVRFRNLGNTVWQSKGPNAIQLGTALPKDRASPLYYSKSWGNRARAGRMVENEVAPGQIGTFLFKVKPNSIGDYYETFQLVLEQVGWIDGAFAQWDFHVSGTKVSGTVDFLSDSRVNQTNATIISLAKPTTTTLTSASSTASYTSYTEKPFRVRISYASDNAQITSDKAFRVVGETGQVLFEVSRGSSVSLQRLLNSIHLQVGQTAKTATITRFIPLDGGIMEISTFERRPAWNQTLNDNRFRGILEVRVINGSAAYINELPLEDYVKGLAEVSNDTPFEKQKTIAVLARTYAKFYMQDDKRKFPGMPYDGNDDPAVFQRYLGYGVEIRSPNFVSAAEATRGMVVTYNGKMVKTPYFNQSDGKTLSALEAWGWTDTPYLQSVDDPYCEGKTRLGHGVGLSGLGAEGMAKAGKRYDEIIKYYYQGVEIQKLSN